MSSPKSILARLIILALLLTKTESKSVFGIGMRIIGDQILVKDILNSRPAPIDEHPEISFCYAIAEPITYIQIQSDENVLAEVNFSYHNDLVNGTVTAVNATKATAHIPRQFEVLITIYGFNETMLNVNPAYILNKNQEFDGVLEPNIEEDAQYEDDDIDIDGENDYVNANHAAKVNERSLAKKGLEWNEHDEDDDDDDDDGVAEHFEGLNAHNEDEAEFPTDFNSTDKVLELGKRQQGDYLLYETFQTSKNITMIPTMHSVVFYYIDSDFITYIKFVVYEHIITESDAVEDTVVAEYSHYTPNSIKALIIDHKSTSLFVQMFVYGFKLIDRPLEYVPYVAYITSIYYRENNEATMSPLQRLHKLMNSFQNTESPTTNAAERDTPDASDTNTTFAVELNGLKNVLCMERSELLTGGGATLSASTLLLLFSPLGMTLMSTLCSTVISSCTTRI